MKTKVIRTVLSIIVIASLTVSCKKEDNSPSSSNPFLSSTITSGSWRVSYYHESNDDHTTDFSGYTFTFFSNGTMTATHSSGTTNGTWQIDDRNANEFHMSLGNNMPLNKLDHGWLIISQTSSEIRMKDDNTNHSEELHFTKIYALPVRSTIITVSKSFGGFVDV